MVLGRILFVFLFGFGLNLLGWVSAQSLVPQPIGDYGGTLGTLHLVLHIQRTETGKLAATLDSPDQGANGIFAEQVAVTAGRLTVTFPTLHASFSAEESLDGAMLDGAWTQGTASPLVLHRQTLFVAAATPSRIDGEWTGVLSTTGVQLALVLHIRSDVQGVEYLTFDTPSQNTHGLIGDHVVFQGSELTFDLPVVHGHYAGRLHEDGTILSGTWTQGKALPVAFTRVIAFVPAAKPTIADGTWAGIVHTPHGELHAVLHVKSDRAGKEYVTLDSPDQAATGLEGTQALLEGSRFRFSMPELHGSFEGTVSAAAIDGVWTQETAMPMHLVHPAATAPPANTAPAPVALSALRGRLNAELKPLIENPALVGMKDLGAAVGVVEHGERLVLTYGEAKPESLFEIGSITKTFTGLLLAQMSTQGSVTLDTPVRTLLPAGTIAAPAAGGEITLLSLATHHSGLPRLPDNLQPADPLNPYAEYGLKDLYAFISKQGVSRNADAPYLYSNLGAALLGQALAAKSSLDYASLLQQQILTPLQMTHTELRVSSPAQPNLLPGYTAEGQRVPAWDLNAFAPAGGLRSDVGDMLTYLEAQLHLSSSLTSAMAIDQRLQADTPMGKIALAWFFDPATGDYSHDGATGGFASFAFFNPARDVGGIVLVNRSSALANSLGLQIAAMLEARALSPLRR